MPIEDEDRPRKKISHEIGQDEIRRLVDAHRQSTSNLRRAGYDGVMLHAAHGAIGKRR